MPTKTKQKSLRFSPETVNHDRCAHAREDARKAYPLGRRGVGMSELRELRVQMLLIGCLACVCKLGVWAWNSYEVQRCVAEMLSR